MKFQRNTGVHLFRGAVHQRGVRRALTLLELLVVLVIMTVVATVAVNALQPRVETARFEQTRSLLKTIRESAVGVPYSKQADGTPLIYGFVADVGRLPMPASSTALQSPLQSQGMELRELWDATTMLAQSYPFRARSGPKSPHDYSHIQIPCGWRGPYLHLPLGQTSVLDPWGQSLEMVTAAGGAIAEISWRTLPPFDQPLTCDLTIGFASVIGTINLDQTETTNVEVVLLAPDPQTSLTELAIIADEDSNERTFTFSQVPIGLRAIHIKHDGGEQTRYVLVPHGGLSLVIDLNQRSSALP